ncbi:hypothetical protein D1B31_06020 [Neobacillus notoginsengisoli]|uniref:Photolyase/cryptochrome alpha/beta domain-containing protein n=1 Tax=Neobacillus notoginsengisoli TaxID=1578198 RepID=A0A417YX88_9BACI|nr:FAD-binding domain-containing protein [Neobacillus notoginsengisoli]RHW42184.1 hypothetical protein D1B31_06020 [Neobacillus notoginsengisoli]
MNIVWFTRDIRTIDHLPLYEAAKYGDVLPLYIFEPSFWDGGNLSERHYDFVMESLIDLAERLTALGGTLYIAIGEAEDVFSKIMEERGHVHLFFYGGKGFHRPAFFNWIKQNDFSYKVFPSIEIEENSTYTFRKWLEKIAMLEELQPVRIKMAQTIPEWLFSSTGKLELFHLSGEPIRFGQAGGEGNAIETMESFLVDRHVNYLAGKKSPIKASFYSSRLSPYLAWGNISLKSVVLMTLKLLEEDPAAANKKALDHFLRNLFKRFLFTETSLGATPVISSLARQETKEGKWAEEALESGKTGIPIIDASMIFLTKTGWLPYALRKTVAFFASNGLGLNKDIVSSLLGSLLLDYDPSIHEFEIEECASLEKNSNYFHIVRAGKRMDKDGSFIKRYIPELAGLPGKYVHEPWLFPGFFRLDYPAPVINPEKLYKSLIHQSKKTNSHEDANRVRNNAAAKNEQLSLDLFSD